MRNGTILHRPSCIFFFFNLAFFSFSSNFSSSRLRFFFLSDKPEKISSIEPLRFFFLCLLLVLPAEDGGVLLLLWLLLWPCLFNLVSLAFFSPVRLPLRRRLSFSEDDDGRVAGQVTNPPLLLNLLYYLQIRDNQHCKTCIFFRISCLSSRRLWRHTDNLTRQDSCRRHNLFYARHRS